MNVKKKKKIVVTGGSGKAGKWIIKHLLEHGYDVLNVDWKHPEEPLCKTFIVDLSDLGQVHSALSPYNDHNQQEIEAIIHFAAIPQPYRMPNEVTFHNNVMNTFNILEAAANLNIKKVVLASSEAAYGFVFAHPFFGPNYLPLDEEHPLLSEDVYGLSKIINEVTAESFHRRTGMQVISFRLGNILEPDDYARVKASFERPEERLLNLWSYIDVRDMASACRLAIEKDGLGAQSLLLVADDTSSNLPNEQLIERFLPELKKDAAKVPGRVSMLTNAKLKSVLGWEQQYFIMDQ